MRREGGQKKRMKNESSSKALWEFVSIYPSTYLLVVMRNVDVRTSKPVENLYKSV